MTAGKSKGLLRRWGRDLTVRYVALTITIVVGLATLTTLGNPGVEIENVRAVLTTLATAEASVLAIVFSVSVVSLQLVVTRYSARLTSLFVTDPLFRVTFALFVGAIAFDLVAVYLLPAQNGRVANGAVGVAFGLAAVSTFALYQFIRLMIQRSSPEELVSVLIERELAPEKYLPKTAIEFEELAVHPIRSLYLTVTRAIELGEYQTAEQGIAGLQTVLVRSFEFLDTEFPPEEAKQMASAVSTEVLTGYFPPLLEQAYDHEQFDLVAVSVDVVEAIALDGLRREFTDVIEDAADGLGDVFDAAPLTWEANRLRDPVTETLVTLTKATASESDYATYSSVSHQLSHQMTVLLRRRPEKDVTRELMGDYYAQDSVEIFDALIDQYGQDIDDEAIDWASPSDGRAWNLPAEAKPLREFWRRYVRLTEAILRYRISEDEYPFADGTLDGGWKQVTEHAAEAGLDGFATLSCISTLQLVYRVDQLENGRLGAWTTNLASLRLNYEPSIVDDAFELLIGGDRPEGVNITVSIRDRTPNDADDGFFGRFFRTDGNETPFEEWLVEFHTEVEERTEYLRERQQSDGTAE